MPVIREKRQYESVGPVGVVRMNTGEVEMYQQIAQANQTLTNTAIKHLANVSKRVGAESAEKVDATRISSINPKTGKPEALDGISALLAMGNVEAEAYERVVNERFQQSIENEIKQKAGEIALKFENDPYSPEKYEEQMTSYLDSMIEGSKSNGKDTAYTNFIMNTGTQYITATKLNMMQERVRRERAKTAQSVADNIETGVDLAYNVGLTGGIPDDLIEAKVAAAKDGADSDLLNPNAESSTRQAMGVSYGQGVIVRMMDGLPLEQALDLTDAFATASPDGLNKVQLEIYNEAVKRLGTTVKTKDGDVFVPDVSAIKSLAAAAKIKTQEIKTDFDRRILESRSKEIALSDNLVATSSNVFSDYFSESQNPSHASNRVLGWATASLEGLESKGNDPYSGISSAEAGSLQSDLVQNIISDAVVHAYNNSEGNPDEVRRSLERAVLTQNVSGLSDEAAAAMSVVLKLPAKYRDETYTKKIIGEFASSDPRNNLAAKRALGQEQMSYLDSQLSLIENALTGQFAQEKQSELQAYINASNLSDVQRASYEKRIRISVFKQDLNSALQGAVNLTSGDLKAAAVYASGSSDGSDVPDYLKQVVNAASDNRLGNDVVSNELSSRASKLSQKEQAQRAEIKIAEVTARLNAGMGIENNSENKEIISDMIIAAARDVNYFSSEQVYNPDNPATQLLSKSIMAGIIPDELDELMDGLSGGFVVNPNQAKNLLTLYSQFRSQPVGDEIVNMWGAKGVLDSKQLAQMEAIHAVHTLTGIDVPTVSSDMAKNVADSGMKSDMRLAFGEQAGKENQEISPRNFVRFVVEDAAASSATLTELSYLASYLYAAGMPADKIDKSVKGYYDSVYKDTDGLVIDPRSLSGSKSRFAVSVAIPNEPTRNFFIDKVNKELIALGETVSLGNGAVLSPRGINASGGIEYYVLKETGYGYDAIPHKQFGIFAVATDELDVREFAIKEQGIKLNALDLTMSEVLQKRQEKTDSYTYDPYSAATQTAPDNMSGYESYLGAGN